jgi:hypothetical protein
MLVSFLRMLEVLDKGVFERYMGLDEAFPKVYKACKKWLEKDD